MVSRNLAIMFTDIQGYTARVSDGTRDDVTRIQALQDRLLRPVVRHFEGTVVKNIGDALMARFESPTDAVLCGVAMQEVLRQHNAGAMNADQLSVRVAIHSGEVELTPDDVHGEAVNIAARLESIAEAGEVYFTESVYLAMNRREAPSAEVGERIFKGIPYPVRVYKVIRGGETELSRRFASAVQLTPDGPQIRGLHHTTATTGTSASKPRAMPRGFWITLITAICAIAVGTVAIALRPSTASRIHTQAMDALAADRPLDALALIEPAISAHPTHAALRETALDAAGRHLDLLSQNASATEAKAWLEQRLNQQPVYEPLRSRLPRLDAAATAESLRSKRVSTETWNELTALTDRYPNNADVPYIAAQSLETWDRGAAIALYARAIERDSAKADDHVFEYFTSSFARLSPGHATTAHQILQQHMPERALAWARGAIHETTSGQVLVNAQSILKKADDVILSDARVMHVLDLIDGYDTPQDADNALIYFKSETSPDQRTRILKLHQWTLKPDVAAWGWTNKSLVDRNLKSLEAQWAK